MSENFMIRCTLRQTLARINLERMEAGLSEITQLEIAEKTGLATSVVSRLASGKSQRVDFTTMDKICRYLKIQPGDLFRYEPDDTPKEEAA